MISDLPPIMDPVRVPLSPGYEISAWPLRKTDGSFLLGVSGEEAEAYAHALGGRLAAAAEYDEHLRKAVLVLPPITHWPHWPPPDEQAKLVAASLEEHGGCPEDECLGGVCKIWTSDTHTSSGGPVPTGMIPNYGFPVPLRECRWGEIDGRPGLLWRGTPTEAPSTNLPFRMLQGLGVRHNRFHKGDYSQGVLVVWDGPRVEVP